MSKARVAVRAENPGGDAGQRRRRSATPTARNEMVQITEETDVAVLTGPLRGGWASAPDARVRPFNEWTDEAFKNAVLETMRSKGWECVVR